jgi:hypothetical protein
MAHDSSDRGLSIDDFHTLMGDSDCDESRLLAVIDG